MLKKLYITVIIVSIMFLCPLIAYADGVNYLGEICINLTNNTNKTVQLGILSYGAGYFSLNGKITDENSSRRIMPASGTAIISVDSVALTLTASDDIYSETYNIIIDLSTLSGWFSSIVHEIFFTGPTPELVSRYDSGGATIHDCPK